MKIEIYCEDVNDAINKLKLLNSDETFVSDYKLAEEGDIIYSNDIVIEV